MRHISSISLFVGIFCISDCYIHAQSNTTVSFDSGSSTILNNSSVTLSGGTSTDGDGTVLQLGYFSTATSGNNFSGTWIPLSGQGSLNTGGPITNSNSSEPYNKTSIGDLTSQSAGNGTFALSLTFTVGSSGTGNSLPTSTSIPLAIRFYDGTTLAASSFFNTVSDNTWLWKTPAVAPNSPLITISLDDPGTVWQGGVSSADKTTLPVPEPSSACVALLGGLTFLIRRRRGV